MKLNQPSAVQASKIAGASASSAPQQYGQLGQMLAGFGSMDLGALSVSQDIKQRSLSMQLVSNVLNQRNDDLKRIIDSLSDKA